MNFVMFWPWGECFSYISICFFNLSIIFLSLLHNVSNIVWTTTFFSFRYPFNACTHIPLTLCDPLFTLRPWQWTHGNPWCNLRYFCYHCTRCWLPHGMITTTCAFFNHFQLFLSTNWHCFHQRWNSHLS